jgi:selenocysteine lyase/cysteine desulfurase
MTDVAVSDPLAHARSLFEPAADSIYLDAATYGLPPRPTIHAMQQALQEWQSGKGDWVRGWDQVGERCRDHFASLIGSTRETVALVPSVSVGVGTIVASLTAKDEVLVPDDEFTSVLFPLLVQHEKRGINVRTAPFDSLAEHVTASTTLVAVSLVQSQSGKTAALTDILSAARAVGSKVLVDATHGVPFVSLDKDIGHVDYLVCAAYKHLLSPRGVAFLHVAREHWETITPLLANWRSSSDPYGVYYGGPLDLAPNAARFDVSLAWFAYHGASFSLDLLAQWQRAGVLEEPKRLARRLAAQLGLAEPKGTVVSARVSEDPDTVRAQLAAVGVKAAVRAGGVRLSPHVWNTAADVDRAAEALKQFVRAPAAA